MVKKAPPLWLKRVVTWMSAWCWCQHRICRLDRLDHLEVKELKGRNCLDCLSTRPPGSLSMSYTASFQSGAQFLSLVKSPWFNIFPKGVVTWMSAWLLFNQHIKNIFVCKAFFAANRFNPRFSQCQTTQAAVNELHCQLSKRRFNSRFDGKDQGLPQEGQACLLFLGSCKIDTLW